MSSGASPGPRRSVLAAVGVTLLTAALGMLFLGNTPLAAAPISVMWVALGAIVVGVVGTSWRVGLFDRFDPAARGPSLGPHVAWRDPAFWGRAALAAASGAVLAQISPPANWHWLHWVVYLPMFWLLREERFWEGFALGWIYGAFALALIFRWVVPTIALYSNIPGPIAWVLLLFGAGVLFGWLYLPAWATVHVLRRRFGTWWVLLFPCVLVAAEYLMSFIIVFPYQMGVAHYRVPSTWQVASITGVWGVSWLVSFVNAAWGEALYRRRDGGEFPAIPVAAAIATLSVVTIWGTWRYERVEADLRAAPTVRIAQLQSPYDMVYRLSHPSRAAFDEWVLRTRQIPSGGADIVVWPEGASPYDLGSGTARDVIGELARRGRFEMVVGGGTRERVADASVGESSVRQFNSVYFFGADGHVAARYDKMVPLIFGEFLPWWLQWMHAWVQGIGDFNAGVTPTVWRGNHAAIASPICYEAIFGRVCRQYADATLIVNVTNDAWFGDTAAPHQHAMLAALRATELGVPMFRSAYSGVSMVVEPHGAIHYETVPFTEVARIVEVRLGSFPTPYRRFGDWFAWLSLVAATVSLSRAPFARTHR